MVDHLTQGTKGVAEMSDAKKRRWKFKDYVFALGTGMVILPLLLVGYWVVRGYIAWFQHEYISASIVGALVCAGIGIAIVGNVDD